MPGNLTNIVNDFMLLPLPHVKSFLGKVESNEVSNLMFNKSDIRLELLHCILYDLDDDLQYKKSAKSELILKELTDIYLYMGFIRQSERSFITGDMNLDSQCKIWMYIISDLKLLCDQELNLNLDEKFGKDVKDLQKYINNPDFMKLCEAGINKNVKEDSVILREKERLTKELEKFDRNIEILERNMINLNEQGLEQLHKSPSKKPNLENCDMNQLISNWSRTIERWAGFNCETQGHHSLSSGYESTIASSSATRSLDSTSVTSESILEDSVNTDVPSETIHNLYTHCKNISEIMNCLKEIKRDAGKIIVEDDGNNFAMIEHLLSLISSLRY